MGGGQGRVSKLTEAQVVSNVTFNFPQSLLLAEMPGVSDPCRGNCDGADLVGEFLGGRTEAAGEVRVHSEHPIFSSRNLQKSQEAS